MAITAAALSTRRISPTAGLTKGLDHGSVDGSRDVPQTRTCGVLQGFCQGIALGKLLYMCIYKQGGGHRDNGKENGKLL